VGGLRFIPPSLRRTDSCGKGLWPRLSRLEAAPTGQARLELGSFGEAVTYSHQINFALIEGAATGRDHRGMFSACLCGKMKNY
jgi:hypothetical protein